MVAALADRRSFGVDMVVEAEIMAHALARVKAVTGSIPVAPTIPLKIPGFMQVSRPPAI
jgi:hypothetical protein